MSIATRPTLTTTDVLGLAKIIQAGQLGMRVARMAPDADEPMRGMARGLVVSPDNPVFLRADAEMRDAYLWVSGIFEHFWPVRELLPEIATGNLAFIKI